MERNELLSSKEYWLGKIQLQLFSMVDEYIAHQKINRTKFASELNVTKGYLSQVLNGNYDSRISKLVELSLAIGKVPFVEFVDLNTVLQRDKLIPEGAVFNNSFITLGQYISISWTDQNEGSVSCSADFETIDCTYTVIND